jgi:hypothetical protein
MKLESLLQLSSIIPLTVGLIACLLVASVPLFTAAPRWNSETSAFMTQAVRDGNSLSFFCFGAYRVVLQTQLIVPFQLLLTDSV